MHIKFTQLFYIYANSSPENIFARGRGPYMSRVQPRVRAGADGDGEEARPGPGKPRVRAAAAAAGAKKPGRATYGDRSGPRGSSDAAAATTAKSSLLIR